MSALALGVLSLFLIGSSQAATMDSESFEPSDVTRLDPSSGISFSIVLDADDSTESNIQHKKKWFFSLYEYKIWFDKDSKRLKLIVK